MFDLGIGMRGPRPEPGSAVEQCGHGMHHSNSADTNCGIYSCQKGRQRVRGSFAVPPARRMTIWGCQCSKASLNLCLSVRWQLYWITTRTLCHCCLRAILAVMGGVAAQTRVLLIPRRTIASMVIVVNIDIC